MLSIGEQFGAWTVTDVFRHNGAEFAHCHCGCGKEHDVSGYQLRIGRSKSCGCLRNNHLRHGYTRKGKVTAEWQAWNHMKQRCYNPNDSFYTDYGNRGIGVCERWRYSFDDFIADMGNKPNPAWSLDRIDNGADYSLENCRWANPMTQAQNRRTVVWIEYNGERRCMADWARVTGINRRTIAQRYYK